MKSFPMLRLRAIRRVTALAVCLLLFAVCGSVNGQMGGQAAPASPAATAPAAPPASPPATAYVTLAGGSITIDYNTPHMNGRKVMGGIVPYGQVWRTGANPATTLITSVPLKFGSLLVPAGTHTIFSLPTADSWQLIISNDVGEWGLDYKPEKDLGRIPMTAKPLSAPQEVMSLTFENTTANSTELHVRWETTDEFVTVTKP